MTIDIEKLDQLVVEADQIFLKPEAEKVLVKLLEIQIQVDDAIVATQKRLQEAALKANPNFKSIRADLVKVFYRSWGSKYKIDETLVQFIPKEMYKTSTRYTAISEEIDKFAEANKGKMPQGVIELEHDKEIRFSLKDKDNSTLEEKKEIAHKKTYK